MFHTLTENNMPREIVTLNLERDNTNQSWGFRIKGGSDVELLLQVDLVRPKFVILHLHSISEFIRWFHEFSVTTNLRFFKEMSLFIYSYLLLL